MLTESAVNLKGAKKANLVTITKVHKIHVKKKIAGGFLSKTTDLRELKYLKNSSYAELMFYLYPESIKAYYSNICKGFKKLQRLGTSERAKLLYSDSKLCHQPLCQLITFEPPHGKTNNLHMRKQRRRSASR